MPYLPSLEPPKSPEPPPKKRWGRLAGAVVPALVGAAAALGVTTLTDDDPPAAGTVTVVRSTDSSSAAEQDPVPTTPAPAPGSALGVQDVVRAASPGVVLVSQDRGFGTGFLVDDTGHLFTNAHVVDKSDTVTVTYADGTKQDAKVLAQDDTIDLAVLEVDAPPASAKPLPLGQSRSLQVGDPVIAIGNPLGFDRTATTGIVSAVKRQICSPNQSLITNAIQTDAAINQGNSGGPLLDAQGRVIGINSQIVSQSGGFVGLGFAVAMDTVRPVAASIIDGGKPQHAWIGIVGEALTPQTAKELGVAGKTGVALRKVDDRGPSKKAGLRGSDAPDKAPPKGGDIIVEIANNPVRDFGDLSQEIGSRRVGAEVPITVLRDGNEIELQVTLADRPSDLGGTCQ